MEDAKLLTIRKINSIKHFNTKNDIISKSTDLDAWYDEKVKDQLLVNAEEFQETNSGWSLIEIIYIIDVQQFTKVYSNKKGSG